MTFSLGPLWLIIISVNLNHFSVKHIFYSEYELMFGVVLILIKIMRSVENDE